MTVEKIEQFLGVSESYDVPGRLLTAMLDEGQRVALFDLCLKDCEDLSFDWFCDYFQNKFSDRSALKQDYTPPCVSDIASGIAGESDTIVDICAGSGSLTIKGWVKNPSARVVCVELSKTVLPFLLFNLSIRGIAGTVIHGDAITRQADAVYELVPDGRYSRIVAGGCADWQGKAGVVVMNPPFSVKWDRSGDARMDGFGIPPKSKGDFVFVLDGLFRLCDDGVLVAVLPHGVLFRGAQEQEIRKNLVDGNYIDAVIGLPPKLFMNTQIPVSIMVLKKNRSNRDILFIDASHEFKNCGRQNVMEEAHTRKVLEVFRGRYSVERFSELVTRRQIEENDYNLNIPRYVDTFVPEPIPDLETLIGELYGIEHEIMETEGQLIGLMLELGSTPLYERQNESAIAGFRKINDERGGAKT